MPRFWLVAVIVGAGGFGVSFLLFNMVIVRVDAGQAAVLLNLIPVFGVLSAVVFLREGITVRDVLGAVLVGSSVLYFAIVDRREASAEALRTEPNAARRLGPSITAQSYQRGPKSWPGGQGRVAAPDHQASSLGSA